MAGSTRVRSFEDNIRKVEAQIQQIQQIKTVNESSATAEGTRFKSLDEIVKKVEAQIQQMQLLMASMNSTRNCATESDQQCEKQSYDVPSFQEESEAPIQEIKVWSQEIESTPQFFENEVLESAEIDRDIEEPKVIPNQLGARVLDGAFKERGESIDVSIDSIETKMADFRVIAIEFSGGPFAHKVFVEMSSQVESSFAIAATIVKHRVVDRKLVFDPEIAEICMELSQLLKAHAHTEFKNGSAMPILGGDDFDSIAKTGTECFYHGVLKDVRGLVPYDRGKKMMFPCCGNFHSWIVHLIYADVTLVFDLGGGMDGLDCEFEEGRVIYNEVLSNQLDCNSVTGVIYWDLLFIKKGQISFPFDRGRANTEVQLVLATNFIFNPGRVCVVQAKKQRLTVILVFDPGGFTST